LNGSLEVGRLSLWELCEGNLEGGLPCWRPFLRAFEINRYIKRYVKMPCKRVSLSTWAPLGNLEGIRLPGLFERK
jgi:hypothetical protein